MKVFPYVIALTGVLLLVGCGRPVSSVPTDSGLDSSESVDTIGMRPTKVDILVVMTLGRGASSVYQNLAWAAANLVKRLRTPVDNRPVRDLHIGIVTSKIDMPYYCNKGPEVLKNDGSLVVTAHAQ